MHIRIDAVLSHFPKHQVPLGILHFGEVVSVSATICGYRFSEKNLTKLDMAGI